MAGQTSNDNATHDSAPKNNAPNLNGMNTNAPKANAPSAGISRRDILRTLAVGAVGGSVLQVIPADAAEYIHELVRSEKNAGTVAGAVGGKYVPKYFSAHQYATITFLCDAIIPKDEKSGGAVEAGAPEFIDLLTSENEKYQLALGGGLMWLDSLCVDRYNTTFLDCYAATKNRSDGFDCVPQERQAGRVAQPRRGVFFFRSQFDVRRVLHQQNRYRRFAIHRQRNAQRISRLPSAADG